MRRERALKALTRDRKLALLHRQFAGAGSEHEEVAHD
jgi:predicted GIY-YIG superfamily endonuclease